MSQVHDVALRRAVSLLNASGYPYAVIDGEGNKFGPLEVVPPKKRRQLNGQYHYIEEIRGLSIGESVKVTVPTDDARSVRSAMTGCGVRAHGNGSVVSAVTDHGDGTTTIELLRVEAVQ